MKPLDERGRVWCFDTVDHSWIAFDPAEGSLLAEARSYHASAATPHPEPSRSEMEKDPATATSERHGTIFVHGGCPDSGYLSDVWAFDIVARIWRKLPAAPGPNRGSAALACTSKRLYRFGGFDGEHQLGGQMDVLELGKETFVDMSGVAETAVIASSKGRGMEWQSITSQGSGVPFPGGRSVCGLHQVTTGQGRQYLLLLLGKKDASSNGHEAAGNFWDDVWTFQLKPDGMTGASFKDAIRGLIGAKTREYVWDKVEIPEVTMSEGRTAILGARGWFASSIADDVDKSSVILWGGINEQNERLGDGYMLTVES